MDDFNEWMNEEDYMLHLPGVSFTAIKKFIVFEVLQQYLCNIFKMHKNLKWAWRYYSEFQMKNLSCRCYGDTYRFPTRRLKTSFLFCFHFVYFYF